MRILFFNATCNSINAIYNLTVILLLIRFRPEAGSLSDLRGRKANAHILKEILELCEIISQEGTPCRDQPDVIGITFGDIFNIYTNISSKCVGLLLRARKQKYLEFEGECLFQVNWLESEIIFLCLDIDFSKSNYYECIVEDLTWKIHW